MNEGKEQCRIASIYTSEVCPSIRAPFCFRRLDP